MNKQQKKISIIGLGAVGSAIAQALVIKNVADEIVFIDKNQNLANAEMLDIRHGLCSIGHCQITNGTYKDIKDSDVIIITAGRSRKSNESRLDLAVENIKLTEEIAKELNKYYTKGIILVVSNPVDLITYYLSKRLNIPNEKIIGTGCILDTSRLISIISEKFKVSTDEIDISIVGEHGNSQVILWSSAKIKQIPIKQYCELHNINFSEKEITDINNQVKNMGTTIISGKKKTFYGISSCVYVIVNAILKNEPIKASVTSITSSNKLGINDISISLPRIIDTRGAKQADDIELSKDESEKLKSSIETIKSIIKIANI